MCPHWLKGQVFCKSDQLHTNIIMLFKEAFQQKDKYYQHLILASQLSIILRFPDKNPNPTGSIYSLENTKLN